MCRRCRVAWAFILLLVAPTVMVGGQVEPGRVVDFELTEFNVAPVLRGGDHNAIDVLITNRGAAPATGDLRIEYVDSSSPPRSGVIHQAETTVGPGQSNRIAVDNPHWGGRHMDGTRLVDPVDFKASIQPSAEDDLDADESNNAAYVQRSVHYHGFSLTAGSPSGDLTPGQQVVIPITVTNIGDVDDWARLEVLSVEPDSWVAALTQERVNTTTASPSRDVAVILQAPSDARVGDTADVTVAAQSDRVTIADGSDQATVAVTSPAVLAAGSLRIELVSASHDATVASQQHVPVHFRNERNEPVSATIQVVPSNPADASVAVSAGVTSLSLDAFESVDVSMQVDVTGSALAGARLFQVEADVAGLGKVTAPEALRVNVLPHHDVQATLGSGTPSHWSPGPAPYWQANWVPLSISNLGNVAETVSLEAVTLPVGWGYAATAVGDALAVGDSIHVPVGATVDVAWLAMVPANETAVRTIEVGVLAESGARSNPVAITRAVALRTTPEVELPAAAVVITQSHHDIPIVLHNRGNTDGTFTLTTIATAQGPDWTVAAPPTTHSIGAGNSTTVTLGLTPPADLEVGQWLDVQLALESDGDGRFASPSLRAMPPASDLRVRWMGSAPESPYLQQPSVAQFEVLNAGTKNSPATTYSANFLHDGESVSTVVGDVPALAWNPPGNRVVLEIPMPRSELELDIQVHVDPTLQTGDAVPADNVASGQVAFRVFDVAVLAPATTSARPGESVGLDGARGFRISNNAPASQAPLDLEYSLTMDTGWAPSQQAHLNLASRTDRTIGTVASVPAHPLSQQATATLRVWPADAPELATQHTASLRILDDEPPELTDVRASALTIRVGEMIRFGVNATDAFGVVDVTGFLQSNNAAPSARPLQRQVSGSEWLVDINFTSPGTYRWWLDARDGSAQSNTASTFDAPLTVVVRSDNVPTLTVVSPTAPLRPGTPYQVSAASSVPLASWTYTHGGIQHAMPISHPLLIPTDAMADGLQNVQIEVKDADGGTATASLQFTVDGTPPNIKAIAVPADAETGKPVLYTVTVVDLHMDAVQLRVTPVGGTVEDVALTQTAAGWVGTATYPAEGTITALAVDTAGNQAVLTQFSSQVQSLDAVQAAPGPALLVLLAALVVVRRRR